MPWSGSCTVRAAMTMEELLREATEKGASDLHLSAGEPPSLRVHGDLTRTEREKLDPAGVLALVESIMNAEQKAWFKENLECDFATQIEGAGRYRVNVFQ